ncbi:hypothetical protein [Mesorhizobium erdmanii]|uniref:hypothetical protein n=1 Tax=Mesorhizobium erdmanii TaxID=1777866 RepID=UPI00042A2C25|nr:hypothetical protein [Mesorhizobium erdmanii]
MAFKTADQILNADPRFGNLVVADAAGVRQLTLADHHATIENISLKSQVPAAVMAAFDRARNILLYAWFDYDLLVVGESQAFGAFEFALKHQLNAVGRPDRGGLGQLIDQARKHGILPTATTVAAGQMDPIDALRHMRNSLAHGTSDIHTPAMALDVAIFCASAIDFVFAAKTTVAPNP